MFAVQLLHELSHLLQAMLTPSSDTVPLLKGSGIIICCLLLRGKLRPGSGSLVVDFFWVFFHSLGVTVSGQQHLLVCVGYIYMEIYQAGC